MGSTGAVAPPSAEDNAQQLGNSLRSELERAAGQQVETDTLNAEPKLPDLNDLCSDAGRRPAKGDGEQAVDIAAVREYAIRELSTQDGTVVLPNYDVSNVDNIPGLGGELATQLSQLQENINTQIAALPQLDGRQLALENIELQADPQQLAAAIKALELQADMYFDLDIGSDQRYDSLQNLGEALLGGQANLEGLDMSELEAISTDLLSQLNGGGDDVSAAARRRLASLPESDFRCQRTRS